MRSSLPRALAASLAVALCLAAAAALADTAAQAPTEGTAMAPSMGWTNSDPRYPTPPTKQGTPASTAAGAKPVVIMPTSDAPPRRNTDPRYPSK
jgi:hypothetical protein